MAESIDEYFTATVSALTSAPVRRISVCCRDCRRKSLWTCSTPSSAAGISTLRRAGCGRGARVSTRSARPGTRATPPSPPRCGPPIPRCCTTAPVASSWPGPQQVAGSDPLRDVLLGLVAATEEPISGGRHKVFGRHDLNVIPQTSTIASHLPRAVGVAFSIARAGKLGVPVAVARRRGRGLQLRRRVGEPLDRRRRHQHRGARRLPGRAAAAAVRLRGQRHRDQRQDADGAGSPRTYGDRGGPRVLRGRRLRPAGGLRRRRGGRRLGAEAPAPGVPAPAHRPADGSRRLRCRTAYRTPDGDHRRLRPRPGAVHRATARRARAC